MPGVAYKDVIKVLLERFPEFLETEEYEFSDPDIAYSVWGGFGRFSTNYMRRLSAGRLDEDPFVNKVFDLAIEFLDSDDPDTQTIVVIELFENFAAYRKTFEIGRRKLAPRHFTWLERQVLGYEKPCDLHYEGEMIAPQGLEVLERTFAGCSWLIRVRRIEPGGRLVIEACDDRIELTMDPGGGPQYSFFGAPHFFGATKTRKVEEARCLLRELSERLTRGDIVHRIALCRTDDDDVLLEVFEHRWPVNK